MSKEKKRFDLNRLLENSRFMKLLSVILGFIVWITVVTTVDTDITRIIEDVPVQINLAGTTAESNGLDVVDTQPRYVDISIEGTNYEIGKLTTENFKATLSLADVTESKVYTDLPVKVERVNTSYDFTIKKVTPDSMTVEFDRMVDKTFTLEASAPNVQPAEGYIIDGFTTTPTNITLTGPESSISKVARCVLENNDKMQLTDTALIDGTLRFLDTEGKEIKDDYLRYDTEELYQISIPLYQKKQLPLTFDYINVPDYINIDNLKYTMSPASTISIAFPVGASSGVDKINLGEIDFRKIDLNKSFSFDVSLLAGYINLDNIQQVTVSFDTSYYSKINLNTNNIVIKNVPAQYQVEVLSDQVSDIRFIGNQAVLSQLTAADVVATVDLTGSTLAVGEHRVPVSITLSGKQQAWAVGEKSVLISVKEAETLTESTP